MNGISLYFKHETRSPNNVILAWHYMLAVPRVGDHIDGPFGEWEVTHVSWRGTSDPTSRFACVDLRVRDRSTT